MEVIDERLQGVILTEIAEKIGNAERTAIQEETDQLSLEIQRIGEQTSFGGTLHLLNGSLGGADVNNKANGTDGLVKFQVGSHSDQTVTASFSDLTFGGLVNYAAGQTDVASGDTISFAESANDTGRAVLRAISASDHDGLKGSNMSATGKTSDKKDIKTKGASPTRLGLESACSPRQTILRFSPVRGITSATVPRHSRSQYSASSAS